MMLLVFDGINEMSRFRTTKNDSIASNKTQNTTNTPSTLPDKISPASSPQQQVTSQQHPRR